MNAVFYISAVVAVMCTALVVTRRNAVHALLYLVVSFLSIAVVFFVLGAPFAAALEVIIYAGAIMVLFVFVVMLLNLGRTSEAHEAHLLSPGAWLGPSALAAVLMVEVAYIIVSDPSAAVQAVNVPPKQVGITLLGPYLLGVELASFLLLAGLVGAFHLGRRNTVREREKAEHS